ncbi:MAG: hypothetical protein M1821_009074 [Bathelium mastoideum]|nr:MAG: hypothetical protein M1821_009074 [Bathelium mastoideum]
MADPLSALGTAVGVFSLGIQVYQGLTGFYRAWDCHDEEIKKTLENMAHGQQILELLRCKLAKQSSSFPASAVQVKACIAQAQAGFCKLDDVLQKCRQTRVPEDFRERVRNVTKRLSYPFKRETVHDLKSAVAEVERTLALAVQYLHLELTDDQRQSLATLPPLSDAISDQKTDIRSIRATTSETVHKVEIVDQKLAGLQALNSQAGTWTTTMQSGITEFRDKLEEIGTNAQSFALTLQGIEKTVDVLLSRNNEGFHASQNAVQELAQQFKSLQLALVSKPSLQRDVSNELQVSPGEHEHDLRNEGILSDSPKRESMQVGAGGLTISPVLAFHPIVPLDAPAFSLLDKKTLMDRGALRGDGRTPTPYLSSYIELALRKLLQLFKERQASPYDTTEHGETLLNVGRPAH